MESSSLVSTTLYEDPGVSRRFFEYLGGTRLEDATASFITHSDGCRIKAQELKPITELPELLKNGEDIDRSLLDRESLLVHLDIEYVNYDSPAQCFLNPTYTFQLQEPVTRAILEQLLLFGIRPLHLLTGQGHHFVWKLNGSSSVLTELTALAPRSAPEPTTSPDPAIQLAARKWQTAFAGLGLVVEFLATRIKTAAATTSRVPVELTALHAGKSPLGNREMISIDISEYGDPLWTRAIRIPFTKYLKPWRNGLAKALNIENSLPPIFTIPFHEFDLAKALEIRSDVQKTRELAQRACVRIPEQSQGMARLIESYRSSALRNFHEHYDDTVVDPGLTIHSHLGQLPPCTRHIIRHPNDLLLKPSGMKLVVRCLMALKVPPKQIARMISLVFKDPSFQWDHHWDIYSPDMRADFYTRIFAGQILTGLDQNLDFNCVSMQEQGFCFDAHSCNLLPWRTRLSATQPQPHE